MGSWAITDGVLQGTEPANSYGHIYYAPAPLWGDYAVEGRFQYPSSAFGGGIGCRVNPTTGAQYSTWIFPDNSAGGANALKLVKQWDWTTWSGTPMAQVSLPSVGTGWHALRLVCDGNRIQVFYDGTPKIDVTDNNYDGRAPYLTGGIGVGMWTSNDVYTMSVDNVVVTTLAGNLPPVAVNDAYSTSANTPLNQAAPGVLANDSDPEGATLTAQLVSGPSHGTLTLNSNGSFAYTPTANYVGSDSFTYVTNDGTTNSNVATVTITILDATPPAVTAFTVPATATTLNVPITSFIATDNVEVTGYLVTESAAAPSSTAGGWSATAPISYTFTSPGNKTLYAWAKDAAGNVSLSRTASVTISYLLGVTLDSPLSGATINRPDVMVIGTVTNAAGYETGVTVNGVVAIVYGNQYVANHVPLLEGSNTITVTATDAYGTTSTASVTVTAINSGNCIRLTADTQSGVTPLTTTLRVDGTFSIGNSTLSMTGPTQPEILSSSADQYQIKMTTEGMYFFTANVAGPDQNQYQDTVAVGALNLAALDTLLRGKWNAMTTALGNRDITTALTYISPRTRAIYQLMYTAIIDQLPAMVATQTAFNFASANNNAVFYDLVTMENGVAFHYEVVFVRDTNGLWVIQDF